MLDGAPSEARIEVNTDKDIDGSCEPGATTCSLRAAIKKANSVKDATTIATIDFAKLGTRSIILDTTLPAIKHVVRIDGRLRRNSGDERLIVDCKHLTSGYVFYLAEGSSGSEIVHLILSDWRVQRIEG